MGLIIGVIFLGVFAVAALLLMASSSGSAQQAKQVQATLDSALATESREAREQVVNLRKNEQLSAIPWINEHLGKMEIAPKLQALIHQANLNWTAGSLLSMCVASAVGITFVVHLKVESLMISALVGIAGGFLPLAFVLF